MGRHRRAGRRPNIGVDSTTWTDHTNLRPTILSLTGLKDDYTDDGRVLVEGARLRRLRQGAQRLARQGR